MPVPFTPNTPEDLENLSDSELKIGYWLTTHRLLFRQILFWFLVVFDVLLLGFSLWQWGNYLFSGYFKDKTLLQEIARPRADTIALREHFSAQPLEIQSTQLLKNLNGKVDAVAIIKNPNEHFFVAFDYYFDLNGFKTPNRRGFLLPKEEKPVIELGIAGATDSSQTILELKNLDWQRFDSHKIKDINDYLTEHLNFKTDSFTFTPDSVISGHPRLTFDLSNETIFNYFEPRFIILMTVWNQWNDLIGVESLIFDKFLSGEKKYVELHLLNQILNRNVRDADFKVVPDINIFNPEAYYQP